MKLFSLALVVALAAQAGPASEIKITPAQVGDIDLSKMNGTFVRQLAWSPDATELYLQTVTEDKNALPKDVYHFVMPASGGAPKKVSAAPAWAAAYWSWKSAQAAPDDASFKIDVASDKRIQSATAIPMGGDLARGGSDSGTGTGGLTADTVAAAAHSSSNVTVYTMRLKGEVVGEWLDHAITPGTTFGWGPAGSHLIAYSEKQSGRLIIMDTSGAKQKIDGTKSVQLPAFSADGTRLAYLEARGRNKFAVFVASVAR